MPQNNKNKKFHDLAIMLILAMNIRYTEMDCQTTYSNSKDAVLNFQKVKFKYAYAFSR